MNESKKKKNYNQQFKIHITKKIIFIERKKFIKNLLKKKKKIVPL